MVGSHITSALDFTRNDRGKWARRISLRHWISHGMSVENGQVAYPFGTGFHADCPWKMGTSRVTSALDFTRNVRGKWSGRST
jgi:hypothetical protein